MNKKLLKLEISGIFFVFVFSIIMQNISVIYDNRLIEILFSPVNGSIWEYLKTLLFPYLIWAIFESLYTKLPFHKFAVAKTISLYSFALIFISLSFIFSLLGNDYMFVLISTISSTVIAFFISITLVQSNLNLKELFYPAIFMLLLFIAFYFSFTPFPPHNFIFKDFQTGLYGISPSDFDRGAVVLDAMYQIQA